MTEQDGTGRRWGGFPGDPSQPPAADHGAGYPGVPAGEDGPPTAPQFPLTPATQPGAVPPQELTAPIPLIGTATAVPPPARPRGSHRRAASAPSDDRHRWMRYLTIGGLAAVGVVAGLYAFAACVSTDVVEVPTVPVVTSTSPAPSATGSPTTPASPTASPGASAGSSAVATTPAARATTSASPRETATSTPSATATKTRKTAVKAAKQPVVVLNSTGITGLARRVAADITAGGWSVPETANWLGAAPSSTTIYYLPGAKNKASAELFAKKFDVAAAVKPALPGMASPLVLVLARDAA